MIFFFVEMQKGRKKAYKVQRKPIEVEQKVKSIGANRGLHIDKAGGLNNNSHCMNQETAYECSLTSSLQGAIKGLFFSVINHKSGNIPPLLLTVCKIQSDVMPI